MDGMKFLKVSFVAWPVFVLFATQVWSMLHWSEARGVFDDVCSLRQAHLLQRFGLAGSDTDISRNNDGYLGGKLKEIAFRAPNCRPVTRRCQPRRSSSIQSPPGTGMALALFPQGHQVIPLFAAATIIVAASRCSAVFSRAGGSNRIRDHARPAHALHHGQSVEGELLDGADHDSRRSGISDRAIVRGRRAARTHRARDRTRPRARVRSGSGSRPVLSAGYFLFFALAFLSNRTFEIALRGFCFGVGSSAWRRRSSPTRSMPAVPSQRPTAASSRDPGASLDIVRQYLTDMQFVVLCSPRIIAYVLPFAARAASGASHWSPRPIWS